MVKRLLWVSLLLCMTVYSGCERADNPDDRTAKKLLGNWIIEKQHADLTVAEAYWLVHFHEDGGYVIEMVGKGWASWSVSLSGAIGGKQQDVGTWAVRNGNLEITPTSVNLTGMKVGQTYSDPIATVGSDIAVFKSDFWGTLKREPQPSRTTPSG